MKKNIIPVHRLNKGIVLSTLLLTYAIVFVALALTVGSANMTSAEMIGCCVNAGIIALASLAWSGITTWRIVKRTKKNDFTNWIIAGQYVPLFGAISNFIILKRELKVHKGEQILKDPNFKHKKEPMSVQVLLVVVTIVVVLAIWLVYSVVGHTTSSDGSTTFVIPGIVDIILSPIKGFIEGAEIIIYLLVMGAFLQAVNSSKALEAGIGRMVKKLRGKELIIIPIIMILFSIGGATFGMCEETIAFYAIVMPIVLAAGFDGITGVIIILFGAGIGVCSSIINPFMIMTSVDAVNSEHITNPITGSIINMSLSDGIAFRSIVYVVFLAIGITFSMLYAKKVKKHPHKSLVYELSTIHKKDFAFDEKAIPDLTTKRKITLIIFALAFVMLIAGAIPWHELTGWNGFQQLNDWLIDVFPFLGSGVGSLGSWYLATFAMLFLTAAFLITLLNWQGANNFYKECIVGAKDFLSVAIVIALARGLSLILTGSGFNVLITDGIKGALGINAILGVVILFLAFIVISIFIPSTSGFAFAVFGPIAAPAIAGSGLYGISGGYTLAGGIASTSIANGLVNLSSPTAGPFVIGCEMARVPLKNFYQVAWKLLLILFVVGLALLIVGLWLPKSIMGQ